jgi:hypothetical protein
MAVKFSQFTVGATVSDIDYIVGYKSTDNIQIPIGLVTANTTYSVATAQSGLNETLTLTGSDATTDVITFTAGNNIQLTDDGAGNGFTISATDNVNTYTLPVTGGAGAATLTLTGSGGDTDPVVITAGNEIQFSSVASGGFTIDSTATGDTYTLEAGAKVGSSVPLNLDAATGTDSAVNLTEGTGITLTQTSATEITIDAAGGVIKTVDQTTIANATTGSVTLSVTPTSEAYTDMYVSGVYQNKSVYSLAGSTITLDGGAYFPNGSIVEVVSTTT